MELQSLKDTVAGMTLPEKIGQMTQVSNDSISPGEVADHFIGSVLSGGNGNPSPNTPSVWSDMVASFVDASITTRTAIPLLYGVDAVHGHSNVGSATVFPHNIGLGAIDDADLVRSIGQATAREMLATGIRWTFAPTIAVPNDIRWGRTYEGYGRDTALVARLGKALIEGLQTGLDAGQGVLACAKHFVGDGATAWDSVARSDSPDWWSGWGDEWRIDQGDARITDNDLRTHHLPPYAAAIEAGALTMMASYNSWNGAKLHGHHRLLTEMLRGELGFSGMVVSDWMGIDQIADNYDTCVVKSINAGIDMVMVPLEFRRFIDSATRAVGAGLIPMSRIDDAVRRILRAKEAAGLFGAHTDRPSLTVVGCDDHRRVAATAVARSAVLLKNDDALPIRPDAVRVLVAGNGADDIGLQCGGWTVGWQGGSGRTTDGSTLLDGLRSLGRWDVDHHPEARFDRKGDVGIVCVAEKPYAEGPGDRAEPTLTEADSAAVARMRDHADVVILVIYSGRPLVITEVLDQVDAVVAAWLPGTEAAALADVLVGAVPFSGTNPQPWPRSVAALSDPTAEPLFGLGHGIVPTGAIADANVDRFPVTEVSVNE